MSHLKTLQQALSREKLDALLLATDVGRFYASDFHSSAGTALILPDCAYLLVDFRYIEACRASVKDFDIRLTTRDNKATAQAAEILAKHDALRVGYEEDGITVGKHDEWKKALPRRKLVKASKLMEKCRAQKEEWELDRMRAAQRIAESVLGEVINGVIREGMTERELAAELIYRMLKNGADGISFNPIVVSGPNSSLPHGVPGDRRFERGDFITMDFGCMKNGYCSDMTRTVALGEAAEEMRKVYAVVLKAKRAGMSAAKAGIKGCDIHKAAADVIEEAGYGEYFGHGFGHGIGIEVHENPGAQPTSKDVLPENSVISAEPGIYLPGKFGVRIEDVIVLRKDGNSNLMSVSDELVIVQ